MKLSEQAEEILETLWGELVERRKKSCDGTLLKDNPALAELVRTGQAQIAKDRIGLTEKGLESARSCVRRHRLAERLMADVLALKKSQIHDEGCRFEHLLHEGLEESVCTLLGHPRFCPHGQPIPEGRCCIEAHTQTGKLIVPLSELEAHRKAQIAYLQMSDRDVLLKLMAIGAAPGNDVEVLQRQPTLVFQTGKTQFAVDHKLAAHIYVRRPPRS